jgi:curved DNA-binding protein CbpA
VRIALDFYRILGIPIQATPEQLQQAHLDRLQQLPHYQHSSLAITARKQLLEEAYSVLSDAEKRQNYDCQFLSKTYALDQADNLAGDLDPAATPEISPPETSPPEISDPEMSGIEIQDNQLAGALLLLHELGEYDHVLEIGRPYINQGMLDLRRPYTGSALLEADIVLTISLSHLELGREQWRQFHYEQAAHSLQEGLNMLLREGLFSEVQSQIRSDLYRLRPYRILELLALPLSDETARLQGLNLLLEMLTERRGIDGTGNDQSGLSIDDFLMFIQQLRDYLTVAEQQEIFEIEARRPSAVGTYLAVYALIAQGFSRRQPALIRRAKAMLCRLTIHQDVYLEQSSCTLLLGQTQESIQALEQSRDYEALAYIREQSEGSPDLLPGIYHYTQRWLQDQVFPHFRDLVEQTVSVQDYFEDQQIQEYLDELAADPPSMSLSSLSLNPVPLTEGGKGALQPATPHPETSNSTLLQAPTQKHSLLDSSWDLTSPWDLPASPSAGVTPLRPVSSGGSNNGWPPFARDGGSGDSILPPPKIQSSLRSGTGSERTLISRPLPDAVYRFRLGGLLLLAILILGGLGAMVHALWRNFYPSPSPLVASPGVDLSPSPSISPPSMPSPPPPLPTAVVPSPAPETPISSPAASPTATPAILTRDQAAQVIQTWQRLKASALGKEHETTDLPQILVEPALSRWRNSAQEGQADQTYWQYRLNDLQIISLEQISRDRVEVMARVNETANFYRQGQLKSAQSYIDNYQVRYSLVRQDNQWLIKSMKVVP